jgi:hypothetical protein
MINGGSTEKAFNTTNVYGTGHNYAKLLEKELSAKITAGGLDNVKTTEANIANNNPHTNIHEITNTLGYGTDILMKTNYKPSIIDQMMYSQAPIQGYNNNRNLKILESIAQTKTAEYKHNVIGANTTLLVDYKN